MIYVGDNDSVIDGWYNVIGAQTSAARGKPALGDTWDVVRSAARLDEREVVVLAAESHPGWQELMLRLTSAQLLRVNTAADELARYAADRVEHPKQVTSCDLYCEEGQLGCRTHWDRGEPRSRGRCARRHGDRIRTRSRHPEAY